MTYGLILIKGKSGKREATLSSLQKMKKSKYSKTHLAGVQIEKVFLSFGWPDFLILMRGKNIEQIRYAINVIRQEIAKHGDFIETSTIVCSTPEEMKEKREEWAKLS